MRKLYLLSALLPWIACVGDSTIVPNDGGPDVTVTDASQDSITSQDAGDAAASDANAGDADAGPTVNYGDITDATRWSTLDLTTVTGGAKGYVGATFDGKHVYYVPGTNSSGILLSFDTTTLFSTANFEKYNLSQTSTNVGYAGAVFDGHYVYLVPNQNGTIQQNSHLIRYDTTMAFSATGSYQTYDLTNVSAGAKFFQGGAFDGTYVYLTPNSTNDVAVRFDKSATFNAAASYQAETLTGSVEWSAAAFDGKFVYFTPNQLGISGYSGVVERYDTTQSFTSTGAWTSYDLGASVDPNAIGFEGGVFDGRYLYLVPAGKSIAVRYDTTQPFNMMSSWSKLDLTTVNTNAVGYYGGTFDGRYVYFAPYGKVLATNGLSIRYDTQQSFTAASSWQTFDLSKKDANAIGFQGAAFDGEYVYFVPNDKTIAVRFDAKTPPSLPSFASSFF